MRVLLERSGGFGGLRRSLHLEGAGLGPGGEERLRAAAEGAGFFALPAELNARPPRPDAFHYRIELEDGGRRHAISFDEPVASEALLALVDAIEALGDAAGP